MKKFTPQKAEAFRRLAKKIARAEGIPHSHALDRIAQEHGFANWSLLQRKGVAEPAAPDRTEPANPGLSDFARGSLKLPQSAAGQPAEGAYLLRFLEGAPVALYRSHQGGAAEIVPTRRDLFQYEGGFGWGYHGSGAQNLCYALAGSLFVGEGLSRSELSDRAMLLLENVISRLNNSMEYELSEAQLRSLTVQAMP